MAIGAITPEEANVVARVLEAKRRSIETCELEARMTVLEQIKKWNDGIEETGEKSRENE
jgi:hypothetical protein